MLPALWWLVLLLLLGPAVCMGSSSSATESGSGSDSGSFWVGCDTITSPIDNRSTGTDYTGRNISVLPVKDAQECCDACRKQTQPNCTAAVWHNLQPEHGLCALKAELGQPVKGNRVAACRPAPLPPPPPPFRFSSAHSDHMVLQAAPLQAAVWGFCEPGDQVTIRFNDAALPTKLSTVNGSTIWTVALPVTKPSYSAYTIDAHSKLSDKTITLSDVLFGDVWLCSGQSNMAYSLNGSNGNDIVHPPVNNSEAEFADLKNHPNIRLFRAGKQSTTTPMLEPHPNDPGGSTVAVQGWTPPTTADGIDRVDFSSMCYFFGRNIQARLDIPIGLIGTYWGGTADELWSSPDALDKCLDPSRPQPAGDSKLWYGMASPFLRSTIKGSIWYQGEADAQHPGGKYDGYNCTFPAMIADWRSKWHAATEGRTDASFPFGFVQLNSIGNGTVYDNPADTGDDLSPAFGYAGLRWSQTASYGYVPNPAMPNVFMAVSEDTPDVPGPCIGGGGQRCPSPGFNVHSRFKQPTAARLARAALGVAYGKDDIEQGPIHGAIKRVGDKLILTIGNIAPSGAGVELKASRGMEVLVAGKWLSVPVTDSTRNTVTISPVPTSASRLRYNWYSNPCGIDCFECAVYSKVTRLGKLSGEETFLPLAPFVMDI